MNRLARSAREGLWTGIGIAAALYGLLVIGSVLLVAWAANPLIGAVVTLATVHWLCHRTVYRQGSRQ